MPSPPNILLILADSAQAHLYGPSGPARTPHADELAAGGIRFERAYSTAAICHPARSVIDTGLYPHANGMLTNRCGRGAYPFRVFDSVPTLGECLREAGYRTGYAGQGHIDVRGFEDDRSYPTPEFLAWLRERGWEERARTGFRFRGCGRLDGSVELARDTAFAARAVDLLEEYAAASQPWFIQCDFDGPHPPCLVPAPYDTLHAPEAVRLPESLRDLLDDAPPALRAAQAAQGGPEWSDQEWRRYIAHFYGMTAFIDALVGRVLEALAALGLADRTLVLFSSDHGGLMGSHGFTMHGSPAFYDPAVHVPLIARWPGVIPAGAACDAFVTHADLLPTLLAAAGAPARPGHGESLLDLLRGRVPERWRTDVYGQYSGDGVQFYSVRSVRSRRWSYTFAPHGGEELYHLESDPGERRNQAADPEAAGARAAMRRRLGAWMEALDDPLRYAAIWRATAARP